MSLLKLRVQAVRHALGAASAEQLIELAHELLMHGVYSYSLGELSTVPNPRTISIAEIGPLFVAAVQELGVPLPSSPTEARALLAYHYIWTIAEGVCTPPVVLNQWWRDVVTQLYVRGSDKLSEDSAAGELTTWYYQYDYLTAIADYEAADEADRQERIMTINRGFVASAIDWLIRLGLCYIDPTWLTWHDGCVRRIARGIAEERAFDRLPILHDALIDAGCDNGLMLEHCRAPGEHADRCLAVDLLLENE